MNLNKNIGVTSTSDKLVKATSWKLEYIWTIWTRRYFQWLRKIRLKMLSYKILLVVNFRPHLPSSNQSLAPSLHKYTSTTPISQNIIYTHMCTLQIFYNDSIKNKVMKSTNGKTNYMQSVHNQDTLTTQSPC